MSVLRTIPTPGCRPTGLTNGVTGFLVTSSGCVVDITSDTVVTKIDGAGGDETASLPSSGIYAFQVGNTLALADAFTNQVYQTLPVGGGHNIAANDVTGEIFIPDYDSHSVLVFAPSM